MKCENCGSKHDCSYGSGRFCCQKCARGFSTKAKRNEINKKVSYKLTKNKKTWTYTKELKETHCLYCGKKLSATAMFYCDNTCHMSYRYLLYINQWQLGLVDGIRAFCEISSHIRRYLFEKYNGRCCKCGWAEINPVTGKVPLQIHHIDGDCTNNKEYNLELLCPNCHSVTPNFGSLNIDSKRLHRLK